MFTWEQPPRFSPQLYKSFCGNLSSPDHEVDLSACLRHWKCQLALSEGQHTLAMASYTAMAQKAKQQGKLLLMGSVQVHSDKNEMILFWKTIYFIFILES